ncbi:hypothetical protein JW777_01020 [bacterium]|nr:hypothetical protein [bacterium]
MSSQNLSEFSRHGIPSSFRFSARNINSFHDTSILPVPHSHSDAAHLQSIIHLENQNTFIKTGETHA